MARPKNKLTDTFVASRTQRGRHGDGGGLYLNVTTSGSRSWIFRWAKGGRAREIGLGAYPALSLKMARELADTCRTAVADDRDPKAVLRRLDGKTLGDVADEYLEKRVMKDGHPKTAHQWRVTIEDHLGPIRSKPIDQVGLTEVLTVLNARWLGTPETARRIRSRLENILDYAGVCGYRKGDNPARWQGQLKHVLPPHKDKKGHFKALPYDEAPAFYAELKERNAMSALALRFLLLTGCRTSEVIGAPWSEISLAERVWRIPKKRMKADSDHDVPLSDEAICILEHVAKLQGPWVFPGQSRQKPLSNMAMLNLLRRMGMADRATSHGFRSTFRDWAGDCTDAPREVAEAALAHKAGGVEAAYRRATAFQKRKALMEQWADYLMGRTP